MLSKPKEKEQPQKYFQDKIAHVVEGLKIRGRKWQVGIFFLFEGGGGRGRVGVGSKQGSNLQIISS